MHNKETLARLTKDERNFFADPNEESFASVVKKYMDGLIQFIYSIVGDFHTAEDLSQDVFMALWMRPKGYNGKCALKTYLYTLGHRKAVDYIRKNSKITHIDLIEDTLVSADWVEEGFIVGERDKAIMDAMHTLPYTQQKILYLLYFEEMSYDDIAVILKRPKKKLYEQCRQARDKMTAILTKNGKARFDPL